MVPLRNERWIGLALPPGLSCSASNPLWLTNSTLPVVFQCSGVIAILIGSPPQTAARKHNPMRLFFMTQAYCACWALDDKNVTVRTVLLQDGSNWYRAC